ncbi:MAG: DsrE family protein [Micrococcales bacterium]|nr:DsrE family protein [Micrococcales bacterium]
MTTPSRTPADLLDPAGVVIHLDEDGPGKQEGVLRNTTNLLEEVAAGTAIELVAHGPGMSILLAGSEHADTVRSLHTRGVGFVACANTMARMGVERDQLHEAASIASSGLAQLVRRQQQGWVYLRP